MVGDANCVVSKHCHPSDQFAGEEFTVRKDRVGVQIVHLSSGRRFRGYFFEFCCNFAEQFGLRAFAVGNDSSLMPPPPGWMGLLLPAVLHPAGCQCPFYIRDCRCKNCLLLRNPAPLFAHEFSVKIAGIKYQSLLHSLRSLN